MTPTAHDVACAYRFFLDREPDAAGMGHYIDAIAAGGMTLTRLRDEFLMSDEYRNLQKSRLRTVDLGGAVILVDPEEQEFGRHIAEHGSWEPHIQNVLQRELRLGDTVVDIGANLGMMTVRAALLVGAAGRVFALEPDGRNFQMLLRTLQANRFPQVIAMQLAMSDRCALVAMSGNSNGSVIPAELGDSLVQAMPGDMALGHLDRLDFVKIDIEGHEPEAVRGMRRLIEKFRPKMLVEFNPLRLGGIDGPRATGLAAMLFEDAASVTAICHDGSEFVVADVPALVTLWQAQNRQAVETGFLPDGMLHFDLLVRR